MWKFVDDITASEQPRTQALHCFYRDQWQLINAKRARVLGQRAKKPTVLGQHRSTLARLALINCH